MTVEWFKYLESLQKKLKDDWANSVFVGGTSDETVQRNAHAIGAVEILQVLNEVSFEEMEDTIYDNKR
jgi:hypothetical protein